MTGVRRQTTSTLVTSSMGVAGRTAWTDVGMAASPALPPSDAHFRKKKNTAAKPWRAWRADVWRVVCSATHRSGRDRTPNAFTCSENLPPTSGGGGSGLLFNNLLQEDEKAERTFMASPLRWYCVVCLSPGDVMTFYRVDWATRWRTGGRQAPARRALRGTIVLSAT